MSENKITNINNNSSSQKSILKSSLKKAFGGGITGFAAMFFQVTSLMWLRTIMNFQYRYGLSTKEVVKKLYSEGGLLRFYKGYWAAIAIGPLSRFGDTASNSLAIELFKDKKVATSIQTVFGSTIAATYRALLMPIDAIKTSLQVDGSKGFINLKNKIKANGFSILFNGTAASMSATFVGHYPWFYVYNKLNKLIPRYDDVLYKKLLRNSFIGFTAAVVSDTSSNSLRVIKTTKQTHHEHISYQKAIKIVVDKDGYLGLFGRGLGIRIFTNGIQGIIFNVLWNILQDSWFKTNSKSK